MSGLKPRSDLQFWIWFYKLIILGIIWLSTRRTFAAEIFFNMMPTETAQLFRSN